VEGVEGRCNGEERGGSREGRGGAAMPPRVFVV
jgi:hypothetical protein